MKRGRISCCSILASQRFTEYKTTYFGKTLAFECTLAEQSPGEVVIVYEISKPMKFIDITFPLGSRSFGYFWEHKNYNVYHWKDPLGKTIVFYFNIAKNTRILEDRVLWDDLIVDIEAFPEGGKVLVLDEDEIPKTIAPDDRKLIDSTRELILSQIVQLTSGIEARTESILSKQKRGQKESH